MPSASNRTAGDAHDSGVARIHRWLALVIASATLLRLFLLSRPVGFMTGDDVELIENAFALVLGLPNVPWEIRNLLFPHAVVTPAVWLAHRLGVDDPVALCRAAAIPNIVLAAVNALLVFRIGVAWTNRCTALIAATLYALHPTAVLYSVSVYPRTAATTCVLLAVLLVLRSNRSVSALIAGALMGVAMAFRYSEAIFIVPVVIAAWARHRSVRMLLTIAAGFGAGVLFFVGAYDLFTRGEAFASLRAFARLTLIERDSSSRIKAQPAWWYLTKIAVWIALPLLLFARASWRRPPARSVAAAALVPLLLLSLIHHKEVRYLQALLPFVALFFAIGANEWWRLRPRITAALLLLAIGWQLANLSPFQRRSVAAVEAARYVAAKNPRAVALSQTWAYGNQIVFGGTTGIIEIGVPPTRESVANAAPHADALLMYASDADAPMVAACAAAGLRPVRTFRGARSRQVIVFARATS